MSILPHSVHPASSRRFLLITHDGVVFPAMAAFITRLRARGITYMLLAAVTTVERL